MIPLEHAPTTADEATTLRAMLDMQRAILLWKLEGLSEADARRPMVPSGTSVLGVVKHMGWVERWWFVEFIGGVDANLPWSEDDPDADFRIEDGDTVASISAFYADSVKAADAVISSADGLDVTGDLSGGDESRRQRSLRWVLVHMIEETARHAGHLDILRELIDGATGYYPD